MMNVLFGIEFALFQQHEQNDADTDRTSWKI